MTFATRFLAATHSLPHKARSFATLPGSDRAPALLAEIATAACAFVPAKADAPIALYGAGNLGRLARDFVEVVGHDFVAVIDRNARQIADDPEWSGALLFHPESVPDSIKRGARLAVCVVTSPYVPLERSLFATGFTDIVPFFDLAESFRHLHPLSNGWFAPPLTATDRDGTAKVLARWDDDTSRAHHIQFLAWRRLREEWTFDAAPPAGNRFFIPEVAGVLRDNEMLLDAGAHHGSVIEMFARLTGGSFRQIVAVEPDPANRARLMTGLFDDPRITIHNFVLAEDEHDAIFHDGLGYASQLSQTGRTRVVTRAIDTLGLSPTFVKLHLEGAELPALKGALQTLLTARPIVAATVYHNADGLWRTAHWLGEALPDYRLLFRSHAWCGNGAVIYAIPKERNNRAA
jgi:FkbM family methyltransferase